MRRQVAREVLMIRRLALATVVLLTACGGYPPPRDQLTAAKAAIRAAEVGGAPQVPKAALQVKHAQDQVKEGEKLMADDDNERAELVLKRAEMDAELALSLAQEEKLKAEVSAARNHVNKLKAQQAQEQGGK
jgi:hypothetical protein